MRESFSTIRTLSSIFRSSLAGILLLVTGSMLGQQECILKPDIYNGQAVYTTVDQMPEYPGGIKELLKIIQKNVVYPSADSSLSSTIRISFVIDTSGKAQNVCSLKKDKRSVEVEKQITEILNKSPNWTPGKSNGKAVCVRFILPITICFK